MQSILADQSRPLLFLHIRKTAGCSVRNWLKNRFPVAGCLEHCHHVANRHVDPSAYQFVTGHVGFDYRARFARRPICFVVLRNPLERALSAYYFFQGNDAKYLQWLRDTIPRDEAEERARLTRRMNELALGEFLEREPELARKWLGNGQSRCLLSESNRVPISDSELLEEASRNLEACDVIGLTEDLPASLSRLAEFMGWSDDCGLVPRDNPTLGRPTRDAISVRVREALTELNRVDLELYRVAERLIASRKSLSHTRPLSLPGCGDFTFDQPIHGGGWHSRERDDRGWFCWSAQKAWLDLKPEGEAERVLEVHVAHVLRPALLDGLQVEVNGRRLLTRLCSVGESRVVEAVVPASVVECEGNRVRVAFALRETVRPCDLVPGNPDTRALGVAFNRIRLIPAKRAA